MTYPERSAHFFRRCTSEWPFWRTLIDNAQMILAKADMTIARLYADLVDDAAVGDRVYGVILDEYNRTVDAVCRMTGQSTLLEQAPILAHSIQRRNPYVDPLSFLQLVVLKRLRETPSRTRNSSRRCWRASTASRRD